MYSTEESGWVLLLDPETHTVYEIFDTCTAKIRRWCAIDQFAYKHRIPLLSKLARRQVLRLMDKKDRALKEYGIACRNRF